MSTGFVQLKTSPRYPAPSAAGTTTASVIAVSAQTPAPASQPQMRRSESRASSGAKTAPSDRTQDAARKSAIHAYLAGWRRGANSGLVHVQGSVPPLKPAAIASMLPAVAGVSANTVAARTTRISPKSPVPTAPKRAAPRFRVRRSSALPTTGAAMTSAKAIQRRGSFGQLSARRIGSNLLMTSPPIAAEARILLPIWSTCAVRPTGTRMSVKSRKRRMSLRKMMTASGSAAMSSTW